jgi:hypothetical protein
MLFAHWLRINESLNQGDLLLEISKENNEIINNTHLQKITKMGLLDQLKNAGSAMLFGEQQPQQNAAQQRPAQQPDVQPVINQSSTSGLYNPQLEKLIDLALADGELTEKEKQVLFKKAEAMGIDLDEFEMVLDARLYEHSRQSQAASQSHAAPQSNKFGDIKKCPACGAMIQSFTTKCPECGYEFRNVEANCSVQRLFEMLNEVEANSREDANGLISGIGRMYADTFAKSFGGTKDTRKKKSIIQNFPIPNTKDDILEFLSLALPLAKKPGLFDQDMEKREMYPTWRAKCEQIIMKARFSMKEDPKTLAEINEYGKQLGIK